MNKFRITYRPGQSPQPDDEEVEALWLDDNGDWVDFYSSTGNPRTRYLVLRLRADRIDRIERVTQ